MQRYVWIFLLVILMLVPNGCGEGEASAEPVAVKEDEMTVRLVEIKAPTFREDFATLIVGSSVVGVQWGDGTDNVMWKESGYPGFGYPIIIECKEKKLSTERIEIITGWGQYEYAFESAGNCFREEGNLVCTETGDKLVHWGKREEILILWNPTTKDFAKYVIQRGTKIVE